MRERERERELTDVLLTRKKKVSSLDQEIRGERWRVSGTRSKRERAKKEAFRVLQIVRVTNAIMATKEKSMGVGMKSRI